MGRRCWTRQIVDLINFHFEGIDDIVSDELELRILEEVGNILSSPGKEIVETQDLVAFVNKTITQMRAEKARAASD